MAKSSPMQALVLKPRRPWGGTSRLQKRPCDASCSRQALAACRRGAAHCHCPFGLCAAPAMACGPHCTPMISSLPMMQAPWRSAACLLHAAGHCRSAAARSPLQPRCQSAAGRPTACTQHTVIGRKHAQWRQRQGPQRRQRHQWQPAATPSRSSSWWRWCCWTQVGACCSHNGHPARSWLGCGSSQVGAQHCSLPTHVHGLRVRPGQTAQSVFPVTTVAICKLPRSALDSTPLRQLAGGKVDPGESPEASLAASLASPAHACAASPLTTSKPQRHSRPTTALSPDARLHCRLPTPCVTCRRRWCASCERSCRSRCSSRPWRR